MIAANNNTIQFDLDAFTATLLDSGYDAAGGIADAAALPRHDKKHIASPHRLPNWRSQRAHELREQGGRFSPRLDGPMTTEYLRMLGQREKSIRLGTPRSDFATVCPPHYRSMLAADEFYEQASSWRRASLEARILARQPFLQIADAVCLSTQAVYWYERLFFQVADRLDATDWIIGHVVGPVFQAGIDNVSQEHFLRYCGYVAGAYVVDQIVSGGIGLQQPANTVELHTFLDQAIQITLKLQTFSAGVTLKPGQFDVSPLMESFTQQQALDIRAAGASEQSDWIATLVKHMSREVEIPRGSAAQAIPADSPLRNYRAGAVELRAAEQNAYSDGGLPYFDQLAKFKPPPPRQAIGPDEG